MIENDYTAVRYREAKTDQCSWYCSSGKCWWSEEGIQSSSSLHAGQRSECFHAARLLFRSGPLREGSYGIEMDSYATVSVFFPLNFLSCSAFHSTEKSIDKIWKILTSIITDHRFSFLFLIIRYYYEKDPKVSAIFCYNKQHCDSISFSNDKVRIKTISWRDNICVFDEMINNLAGCFSCRKYDLWRSRNVLCLLFSFLFAISLKSIARDHSIHCIIDACKSQQKCACYFKM